MALQDYRQKRDFTASPEPKGRRARKGGTRFVIHKHAARRLHYDLRLEMDGVLRSWAVTRGPSLVAGEKRLAVQVEDHPLDYADFEGTIPKGEYGGGTVIVWDQGHWLPIGDAAGGYAKGHLEFELRGEKLAGRWHLIRMQQKPGESRENWLLIKADDAAARPAGAADILTEMPLSAKTGRDIAAVSMAAVSAEPPGQPAKSGPVKRKPPAPRPKRKAEPEPEPSRLKPAKKAALPDFVPPMLASLAPAAPKGAQWLHEVKFDGYRLQARIDAGRVTLRTRSGLDWTARFGTAVPQALAGLDLSTALMDGEMVVETAHGATDFSALQADLSDGRNDRFTFYVFDLMHLNGHDLTALPLWQRKAMLAPLIAAPTRNVTAQNVTSQPPTSEPLRYSPHFHDPGAMVLRHACRLGLEGVVSKRRDSPYRTGRGRAWIKSKCTARQEFVIGGYTASTATPQAIGSLLLGVHDDTGSLNHVGRVGTGFTAKVAKDLFRRLTDITTDTSPFARPLTAEQARQARFVRPDLVAEVEFRAWTADDHLRHAAFRGLREDKPAPEVTCESAAMKTAKPPRSKPDPTLDPPLKPTITPTHPERIYWPAQGITKEGLADYYSQVWRHIAPFVVGRPLALLRCPEGIGGPGFFQKHPWKGIHPAIRQTPDPPKPKSQKDPKSPAQPLLAIDGLDGLIALVQSAALEIHPWGSTLADLDRPDLLTMDLDPDEGVPWPRVIDAAQEVRQRLTDAGLAAFVKTSGGKGLHVVAPLKPHADWATVKAFCKTMAQAMARDTPAAYVATISKSRRKGKILIDYLRNQRGATAVAAYSSRARPTAAVSAPLAWSELGPEPGGTAIGPAAFTIENMPARINAQTADPWQDFHAAARILR